MRPVHEQRDADAALGEAWRRCEAAARSAGYDLASVDHFMRSASFIPSTVYSAAAVVHEFDGWDAVAWGPRGSVSGPGGHFRCHAATPTEALTALAEQLETRVT